MKKIGFSAFWSVLLFLGIPFFLYGAPSPWSVRPDQLPNLAEFCDVWLEGGKPASTNISTANRNDGFSPCQLYFFGTEQPQTRYWAKYEFEIAEPGEYYWGVALVHQGTNYASQVRYRFDDEPFAAVPAGNRQASWGFANAVGWSDLGVRYMEKGKHQLEFEFDTKADNGNWSFLCDGVAGIRAANGKKIEISGVELPEELVPGEDLVVKFEASGTMQPIRVKLESSPDYPVVETIVVPQTGKNQVVLHVPEHLGSATYEVSFYSGVIGRQPLTEVLKISARENLTPMPHLSIEEATVDSDGNYRISLTAPAAQPGMFCVMLEIDGKVYAVDNIAVSAGEQTLTGEFSDFWRAAAAGRSGKAVFYAAPGEMGREVVQEARFAGVPGELPKPINYGLFKDRFQLVHPWYMDHEYRYIFDGKPYFPVGAMWCTQTLRNSTSNDEQIAQNFAFDCAFLDQMLECEIDDFYFNQALAAPLFVRQFFIDEMEKRNVNYAWQLTIGELEVVPSYFITRDAPERRNFQGLVRGVYREKEIVFELSPDYKVIGVLAVPENDPGRAYSWSVEDSAGQDSRSAVFDFDRNKDHGKLREIRIRCELDEPENSPMVLIPLLAARMSHPNLLDEAYRKQAYEHVSWIGKLNWGPHFRFIVDPGYNETHMTNGTENLRQFTPAINARFEAWLKKRYADDFSALRQSWAAPELESWENAVRVIPLRLGEKLYLCDPETGKMYASNLSKSQAWLDYNEMIREEYALEADRFAMYIKSLVDIPIVYKSVEAQGSRVMRSTLYRGFDGVGSEVYLNQARPPEGAGGGAKAAAEAATHTVWKVGTELGHDAQLGNGGVKFFQSEAEINDLTRQMAQLGVSGFYYFGAHLGDSIWDNHGFYGFPEGMKWLKEINRKCYPLSEKRAPRNYLFPGGHSWWWWTTRHFALYDRERSEVVVSLILPNGEWATNTELVPEDWERVVVNCALPPYSIRYAPRIGELARSGREFIYLGERRDLGVIPEVDRYFTEELIEFPDGSKAQVLKAPAGAEILASENGRPWAIRDGNCLIVSRFPICNGEYVTHEAKFVHLKPEWINAAK